MRSTGILLCLASAVSFGAMGIFGKLAYDEGASVGTLLSVRFSLAALLFWLLLIRSGAVGSLRTASRRDLGIAVGLGAIGYSAQTGCYFSALDRMDASLLALLVYTFPAIVTVAAILLGRERASRRVTACLVLASVGLVLVLAGAGAGTLDPLGAVLGLAAAFVYSAYILTSEGVAARLGPLALSTLVCTGAAPMLIGASALGGDLHPGAVSATGFGWIAAIAVVSTVTAISLFFAGLRLVGATTASIVSTAEPLTTVALAYVVFGESLAPAQMLGGALVLLGVLLLSAKAAPKEGPLRTYRLEPTLDD
jgi:drug/metabolite transporter (DMT)-like permease